MTVFLRGLARLLAPALLAALTAVAVAVAIFSIEGGRHTMSLASLAGDLHLFAARAWTHTLLARLEAPGSIAWRTVGGGIAALGLGLALLAGAVLPRRRSAKVVGQTASGGELRIDRHTLRELESPALAGSAAHRRRAPRRALHLGGGGG